MCNDPVTGYDKIMMTMNLCEEIVKDECGECECKLILTMGFCEGNEEIKDCPPPCYKTPFDRLADAIFESHCETIKVFKSLADDMVDCEAREKIKETMGNVKELTCGALGEVRKMFGMSDKPCPKKKPKDVAFTKEESLFVESLKKFFSYKSSPVIEDQNKTTEDFKVVELEQKYDIPNTETADFEMPTSSKLVEYFSTATSFVESSLLFFKETMKNIDLPAETSSKYDVPTPRDH